MTRWLALAAVLALAGCAPADDQARSGADSTAALPGMRMDGGSPGGRAYAEMRAMMDSVLLVDSLGGLRHGLPMPPASDGDQLFLRMMSDHQEGLIRASREAMSEGSTDAVRADARAVHQKHQAERDTLLALLHEEYQDQHAPAMLHRHRLQADDLSAQDGAAYDQAYYAFLTDHHRNGLMMIDDMLPRLRKPAVRQLAGRMKVELQRQLDEFEQKLVRAGGR